MTVANKERVLVVDDEPNVLVALDDLLSDDFEVLTARDGAHALEVFERQEEIAVVITDQRMPKVSGDEMLARLPETHARRILLTGYTDSTAVARAVNEGHLFAYLAKPWTSGELREKVRLAASSFRQAKQLAGERRLFDELMNEVPDGVFFKDEALRFTRVNRAFAAMMRGLEPSDVVGRTLGDLGASAAEIHRVESSEQRLLAEGGSIRDELRACHVGDKRRWLSTTRTTIRDERGHRGIAGVVRDLTDRVEATEALRKSNAELEQFAYVTSHELQEPVRAIANYSELLKEHLEGKLEAPADTFLHYIAEGAVRMRQRVAALLEYCRMDHQGQRLSPVSVAAALDDVRLDLRILLNETGATLHVGELPSVLGDKTQLTRLLRNLVENALKFRASQSPVVRIDATLVGSHFEFSVADNGIGLDTRKADRIFQMFQRLHRQSKYPGHGIGLAMCKRIVDLHGGTIWVESQMGKGATFKFTLMAAPMLD